MNSSKNMVSRIMYCLLLLIDATIVLLSLCASQGSNSLCLAVSMTSGNETDLLALLKFKDKITKDPLQITSSWNVSNHFCQWEGVTCSRRHQRVVRLDLPSLGLSGSISPFVGNLSFLKVLQLQNNSLREQVPPEIGRLRRLQDLKLSNNTLVGKIPPNISACSNLKYLSFGRNKLVGEIPPELGLLLKMTFIALHVNNLTGNIPPSFGNLSSLETLSLSSNQLGGKIPDSLGRLKNLKYFLTGNNSFVDSLPQSLFNISSLLVLQVPDNHIKGSLPTSIGLSLPNIIILEIAANQFSGTIPSSLSNATNLKRFGIAVNQMTGGVPSLENLHNLQEFSLTMNNLGTASANDLNFLCSLANATALEILAINVNNFGGTLPDCVGTLSTTLRIMVLESNMIVGSVPSSIGNLIGLQRLDMWENKLSGKIPSSIGNLNNMMFMLLAKNNFSGEIPHSIGNLTLLFRLDLRENNLQGNIPPTLGECRNLIFLNLANNSLSGTIPSEVLGLSSLSMLLDLSQNNLIGSLPREVGNLQKLGTLYLHNNHLSGEIPSTLGDCKSLETLTLAHNFFEGQIPLTFSSLKGLQFLDLSYNNLSGEIPQYFASFSSLLSLDFSFNHFEGMVPIEGVFKNASAALVVGNDKLCGGIPQLHLHKCKSAKHELSNKMKAIIVTISAFFVVSLIAFFVFLFWSRKKNQTKEQTSLSLDNQFLRVSYQNLYNATNGFSSSNLIGVGSFGSVYKGILGEGGIVITTKVLNFDHHGAVKSFMKECEALRNIKHRNLVKVLTACSSVDYQGNDFKALVYEFMDNGSLENWLHEQPIEANSSNEVLQKLSLLERLNIAIDVASALEYLHNNCDVPVVHCDVKPSNILLDKDLTGHLGDFGLAKFLSQGISNQSSSFAFRGTIGYAPPEYGLGSQVSTQGDIYSYGILLLEMFTGKRPTNEMFKEGYSLHKFAESALPNQVTDILDRILLQEINEWAETTRNSRKAAVVVDCLVSVIKIGVACSVESPGDRMKIVDVVSKLCSVRDKIDRRR